MNKEEINDLRDHYFDVIIRRRTIPRRTNWRHRADALSQLEVALAGNIQSSAHESITFIFVLMFFTRQLMMMISTTCRAVIGGPEFPLSQRLLRALIYYNCLLSFCFLELDVLIERDDALLNV
jgi:hypothetical protein